MNRTTKGVAACMAAALVLSSCATAGGGPQQSALDRSINQCVAAVAIGALLGGLADKKNRGQGAAIGAGVGGLACGVLVAINNERDKQRVRDAQRAALNAGTERTENFVGEDGQTRVVQTSVRDVPTPATFVVPAAPIAATFAANPNPVPIMAAVSSDTFVGPCRNAQSQITVQGQTAQLPGELYCRTPGGDWN